MSDSPNQLASVPNERGYFGAYGGVFVPETLIAALDQLTDEYKRTKADPAFKVELAELQRDYIGRPVPLQYAKRLTEHVRANTTDGKGAQVWLKREDLAHSGAHKINNTIGQALLAKRMGKPRIIAETGAGQHGVGTATACALLGLDCEVYMGTEDMRRQRPNVVRMELLGAKVRGVESGDRTLKDALNEAMRDWMGSVESTHYILGTVAGPHPFPMIVRDFQAVIGEETRQQSLNQIGRLPDVLIACVGGGSNAAGFFYPMVGDADVRMIGVEAGGRSHDLGDHAAPLTYGQPGVLHGSLSYVLQDDDGQTAHVHSISAGLDYPGVGPEHSYWKDTGRVEYTAVDDDVAIEAFKTMCRIEGIIPALESSHALAHTLALASEMDRDQVVCVNVSGRGDKDLDEVIRLLGK